ncbi:MAG: M15 family metallopeptidase, partial [Flavitalea sp.]
MNLLYAQADKSLKNNVKTLNSRQAYLATVAKDPAKKLIGLQELIPDLVLDLRYASGNNFVKKEMYPAGTKETFLRYLPALQLQKIQAELNASGLGLKIYDAYRPFSVTVAFWDLVKDSRYVAKPVNGSAHNRGLAVDLTLVDLKTGKELDMGTDFDDFSSQAGSRIKTLPGIVVANRQKLRDVMMRFGFKKLDTEWWHFSWANDRGYEVL